MYSSKIHCFPVTVRSKAYVCSRMVAGNARSNPAEVMDVRLLCLLFRQRLLRRGGHSFGGVLPVGLCVLIVI